MLNGASVEAWLLGQGARAKSEWIQFVLSNVPTDMADGEEALIYDWILQQFLYTDLAIAALPCLELLSRSSMQIILQVEELINISEPFYSQTISLQEELDGMNSRLISGEDETGDAENVQCSKSLFKYVLSDGFTCIYSLFLDSLATSGNFGLEKGSKIAVNSSNVKYFEHEKVFFIEGARLLSKCDALTAEGKKEKLALLKRLLEDAPSN